MAAPFPVEIPSSGASGQEFEPQRVDYLAPEASGYLGGEQAGFPLWLAVWTLGKMGRQASDDWRAWSAERRGAQAPLFGYDLARPYPKAHIGGFAGMVRAGGGAYDGGATGWSEALDAESRSHLTLHGLPAVLTLSTGDYVGFKWDADGDAAGTYRRRALVRVTRGPVVASGGGDITVVCEPPVPPAVPPAAIAHLDRPMCVMRQLLDQTKLGPIDRRLVLTSGTIVALQDLRP